MTMKRFLDARERTAQPATTKLIARQKKKVQKLEEKIAMLMSQRANAEEELAEIIRRGGNHDDEA